MPKYIYVEPFHTEDELKNILQKTTNVVLYKHIQVIMMIQAGYHTKDITQITTLSSNWIYEICRRYNKDGLKGLGDRREHNGAKPKLSPEEEYHLQKKLLLPLSMVGFGMEGKS